MNTTLAKMAMQMSHILRQNPKTQKSLYQPLDKNSSEVRLLEIEPSVNSKSAIRCRLRKVSLTDELRSPPASREASRSEKNHRYFDLQLFRLCTHIEISYSVMSVLCYKHY